MFCHVVLAAFLYVLLTIMRAPAVWGIGASENGENPLATVEKRVSANLSNQFEWPLFFHVVCILLVASENFESIYLWLAWLFVAGRVVHSVVQVMTNNVRLRGVVFTINFLAVLAIWAQLVMSYAKVHERLM